MALIICELGSFKADKASLSRLFPTHFFSFRFQPKPAIVLQRFPVDVPFREMESARRPQQHNLREGQQQQP